MTKPITEIIKSINNTKENVLESGKVSRSEYIPFIINRTFSYFPDTVLLANEVNQYIEIDKESHYGFYLNIVSKKSRFSKWNKKKPNEDIDAIKKYFGYNNSKAKGAMEILSKEEIQKIKDSFNTGGLK